MKPATVRFYFDADILGLAKVVGALRPDVGTVWGQLEVLMTQWRRIERLHELPGPFIYRASRSSLQAVELS